MRTVFTNDMLLHVFVQQTQAIGRSNSMRFDGDTLWSYGTPIARIMKDRRGRKCILVTSKSYSITTQQHKSGLSRAFRGHGNEHRVPSIGVQGGHNYEDSETPNHAKNLAWLQKEFTDYCAKAYRAINGHGAQGFDWYAKPLNEYAEAFRFKLRVDAEAAYREVEAKRDAREARLSNPNTASGRARMQAKARAAARAERERIEREARHAEMRAKAQADVQRWKDGEVVRLWHEVALLEDGSAMLRVKPGHPETVETSLGAEVPMAEASMLHGLLTMHHAEVIGHRIGHFTLNKVNPDGSVNIGCHFISRAEIDRFAQSQGWR